MKPAETGPDACLLDVPAPADWGVPFDAIIEQMVAGIYIIQDDRFVYANATFAKIIGYSADELIGMSLPQAVPADFLEVVRTRVRDRLAGQPTSMHFVSRGLHRNGQVRYIEVHGSRIAYRGQVAVMGVGVDVTERIRNEEELLRSREQLRALTAHTTEKIENQRLALAREVHDVLGGLLTAIKMDAVRIRRRAVSTESRSMISDLVLAIQQIIETVKQISEELRPSALDHLDISVPLAQELQHLAQKVDVACDFQSRGVIPRLSTRQAVAVFRIFQEGLTNIARHARARRIDVTLTASDAMLCLKVRDDGCGFDVHAVDGRALGLLGMRERAREIGGQIELRSAPGDGTSLLLSIPVDEGLQ